LTPYVPDSNSRLGLNIGVGEKEDKAKWIREAVDM
jgi:hypothetical protein